MSDTNPATAPNKGATICDLLTELLEKQDTIIEALTRIEAALASKEA